MIEVILMERIERLGGLGDVVRVRPGFARNFLLPQKKALRATKSNLDFFAAKKAEIEASNQSRKTDAEKLATKVEGSKLVMIRQAGDMGQLFGSVSARDVAQSLKDAGTSVDKNQVQIDTPIKTLGLYKVKVRLHPEVAVTVSLNVARSEDEAIAQEKSGVAATARAAQAEADAAEAVEAAAAAATTTEETAEA